MALDLALLCYPDTEAIVQICERSQPVLGVALGRIAELARAPETQREEHLLQTIIKLRVAQPAAAVPMPLLLLLPSIRQSVFAELERSPQNMMPHLLQKEFCADFLRYCDEIAAYDYHRGLALMGIAVRICAREGDPCLRSRSFARLMGALIRLGRYDHAERAYTIAGENHTACNTCQADLRYRCAHLRAIQGRLDEAFLEIGAVRHIYENLEESEGVGKALFLRGVLHERSGDRSSAKHDLFAALENLDPSSEYHIAALRSLAITLAGGTTSEFMQAIPLFPRVIKFYAGKPRADIHRARLRWIWGQVAYRAHVSGRAIRLLTSAQGTFLEHGMTYEAAGVTADLALFVYPDRKKLRELTRRLKDMDMFGTEIRNALRAVYDSTRTTNPFQTGDPDGRMRDAIQYLREAVASPELPLPLLEFPADQSEPEPDAEPIGF